METEGSVALKKALRQIALNIEQHGMMSPSEFTKEDISVFYSLGISLYQQGDYTESKSVFQRLVMAHPHEKKFWMGLAAAQQMGKEFDAALTAWAMTTFLDDENPMPHFHAAECLFCLEQHEEAFKALNAAKKRAEENCPSLKEKIEALEEAWASQKGVKS